MNKILFLYTNPYDKADLLLWAEALKTVLRKFRKSMTISLLNIDLSPSCRKEVKNLLSVELADAKGIMFSGNKKDLNEETAFFKDCLNLHSVQYFSSGKCICYPVTTSFFCTNDGVIKESFHTEINAIENAVKLALNSANSKKEILLCTNSKNEGDRFICNEFINLMAGVQEISAEHFDFEEMLSFLSQKIPSCDVILTVQNIAHILAIQVNSLNRYPFGYSVLHGDNVRIYKRESLPYEDFSNLSYANFLIGCAGMLENELGFKNAGVHLRKALTRTIEQCHSEEKNNFQKHLLFEINKPIRHRQVKTNEGNN